MQTKYCAPSHVAEPRKSSCIRWWRGLCSHPVCSKTRPFRTNDVPDYHRSTLDTLLLSSVLTVKYMRNLMQQSRKLQKKKMSPMHSATEKRRGVHFEMAKQKGACEGECKCIVVKNCHRTQRNILSRLPARLYFSFIVPVKAVSDLLWRHEKSRSHFTSQASAHLL
jgi:hypothetical protein